MMKFCEQVALGGWIVDSVNGSGDVRRPTERAVACLNPVHSETDQYPAFDFPLNIDAIYVETWVDKNFTDISDLCDLLDDKGRYDVWTNGQRWLKTNDPRRICRQLLADGDEFYWVTPKHIIEAQQLKCQLHNQ